MRSGRRVRRRTRPGRGGSRGWGRSCGRGRTKRVEDVATLEREMARHDIRRRRRALTEEHNESEAYQDGKRKDCEYAARIYS